jgi:leader peptidase (prepilin peptidase)/N-methyltransferase
VAAGAGILLGGVAALVALAFGAGRKTHLPFGPFLAAGAVLSAFLAEPIADLYLRTFT